ncbi:hypothetical protein [Rhizobium laguerreae]|uniref:hypothetical protein n=1 Tax=Rhizobium laguerreae TaxID=1076926 RepID=UPI001C91C532|nr:hypothetical protein [Rhizobium laguerreae]MBY3564144.1 hypothetical protein [Rhizobium laguerreae]
MLTDLPNRWVGPINELVKDLGYNGMVLVADEGDPISDFGKLVFKNTRHVVDRIIDHMKITAKIHVAVIVDSAQSFQACAVELDDDEFCILIWMAALIRTSASLSRLLATPAAREFFALEPELASVSEVAHGENTFAAYDSLSLLPRIDLGDVGNDFRRYLEFMASEWLVLHEIGHIVQGHLAVGKTVNGLTYILEQDPSVDRDYNITSQALEVDADCFANLFCVQYSLGRHHILERDGASHDEVVVGRLKPYLFSMLSVLRSFDHSPLNLETLFDSDHPPGCVRMSYLLAQMLTMQSETTIDFKGANLVEAGGLAAITLERAISEATGVNSQGGNLLSAVSIPDEVFRKPVLSRWAKIYPELNAIKLSPFKLARPQYEPA